jgi:hypothetical protein
MKVVKNARRILHRELGFSHAVCCCALQAL